MHISKYLKRLGIGVSASLLLTLGALAADTAPYGLLSSWTESPTTTRTFTWRDDIQAEECIQLVPEESYEAQGFDGATEVSAKCQDISLDASGAYLYEVTASELEPGTSYVFRVGSEDGWSEAQTFTTEAEDQDSVTFAYMGDAQPAGDTEEDYALWRTLTEALAQRNPELSCAIMGGDIVNSGISVQQFDAFRENASSVFSTIPLFSTVGNHESNFLGGKPELYLEEFAFPENGPEGFEEECYSFDVGNCHILVLNSWIFSGEQKLSDQDIEKVNAWVMEDLISSTAQWQVVVLHVPVYAVHSDTTATAVRENWAPIFESCGVDLVFEGHQHVYSRSYPMYQGQIDYENGIPYVMGVSGTKFYDSADETFAERTIYNQATYQLVHTDGNTMTLQTMNLAGEELDFATISQREVTLTRGEYLEQLWKAAGSPEPTISSPFVDTEAASAVWAYEVGYIRGYGNGYLGSNDPLTETQREVIQERIAAGGLTMTRADYIETLWRAAGSPQPTVQSPFRDTSAPAVVWAYEMGYCEGYGNGYFGPDDPIKDWQKQLIKQRMEDAA